MITGGSGLLAVNWAAAMRDHASILLGTHERQVSLRGAKALHVSLSSANDFARDIEKCGADVVIHTAGLTDVEACENDPALAHSVNVGLAANAAAACNRAAIPFVQISTDHLGNDSVQLMTETDPIAPMNVYAATKAAAEAAVSEANESALIIRTNFYGWGTTYRHSFSDNILRSLRAGEQTTLFTDVFYTPILAEPLAMAVHCLVDSGASGTFNVSGDERISKFGFGLKVASYFGLDPALVRPGKLEEKPALVPRPHQMALSNAKLRIAIGRPLGGVDEHLARLREQESNGLATELCL